MAFLICHARDGVTDWRDKAIYLDQDFYELACALRADFDSDGVLVGMVSLKYGDEILLSRPRLETALDELDRLAGSMLATHPQFESFRAVIRSALDGRSEIAIAGDMFPERL